MKTYKLLILKASKCPNCGTTPFNGDCANCGFDATEIDIY